MYVCQVVLLSDQVGCCTVVITRNTTYTHVYKVLGAFVTLVTAHKLELLKHKVQCLGRNLMANKSFNLI